MNIYFVGQPTILGQSAREKRIRALAEALTNQGHTVVAFSATEKHVRRLEQLTIRSVLSLSRKNPGGLLYTLFSLISAIYHNADVIHLTTWRAAALAPFAALFRPETTFVWTVDSIPKKKVMLSHLVVFLATRLCDAITTPTRSLQYTFRLQFNVLPTYIPDGFSAPALKDIPAKSWKLRKNTYSLVIADTASSIRSIVAAYKLTKKRKKLVVLVPEITPDIAKLDKRTSSIRCIESSSPRQRASLIRQAESVVFLDSSDGTEFLLAMDSGRHVLASNEPRLQEVGGATVPFFVQSDKTYLAELLRDPKNSARVRRAQKRARAHFAWERIFEEYETLYHYPIVRHVALDSVQPHVTESGVY